jgi:hypothetical protein
VGRCFTNINQEVIIMAAQKCPECDWEIKDGGVLVKIGDKQLLVCCDDCAKEALAKYEAAASASA